MNVEMHRADPRFRRTAPLVLLGVLLLGGVALWALQRWLDSHTRVGLAGYDGLVLLAIGVVALLVAVSLGIAISLWLEARRIQREDRFPPSDMRTLRDVPVRHGAQAQRCARYLFAAAVIAALAAFGILLWGFSLMRLVG
jgi:hypothetical protein